MRETTRCIRCGKPATTHAGFVERANGERILAGWCRWCDKLKGYSGSWLPKMGQRKERANAKCAL